MAERAPVSDKIGAEKLGYAVVRSAPENPAKKHGRMKCIRTM